MSKRALQSMILQLLYTKTLKRASNERNHPTRAISRSNMTKLNVFVNIYSQTALEQMSIVKMETFGDASLD